MGGRYDEPDVTPDEPDDHQQREALAHVVYLQEYRSGPVELAGSDSAIWLLDRHAWSLLQSDNAEMAEGSPAVRVVLRSVTGV
jgi:hypothetical protein